MRFLGRKMMARVAIICAVCSHERCSKIESSESVR